jgi:hypothetical protein
MTLRETLRRTGALAVSVVTAMTMATPALAACGLTAESVAKAQVAFVGLLTDVSADGTNATFNVEDIWRGDASLVGGAIAIDTTNSLQRLELPPPGTPPSRYLVLAKTVGGQLHTGDSCELFPFPWDEGYAVFRPADASPPPAPAAEGGLPGPVLLPTAAFVVLGVVGVLAFRRGSGLDRQK